MTNPEVMVVLGDGGKPVTVIRALDDDDDVISRDQRSTAGARVSAEAKKNSSNRYSSASSFIDHCQFNFLLDSVICSALMICILLCCVTESQYELQ